MCYDNHRKTTVNPKPEERSIAVKPCICLLNDSFPPMIDGVATAVFQYAQNITAAYGQAVVATPDYPDADDRYPFPVVRYPSVNTTKMVGYRTGLPFSAASLRELEEYPISLIHSHCPFVSTYLARTLRQSRPVPVVFTYHTKFDIDIARAVHTGQLQSAAIRLLVDNVSACDEVWVVSRGAGENLRSLGYEGEVRLMENGVDFPRGKASPEAVDALLASLKERYGLIADDGAPCFLFVGRMMWYKGIRLILDALAALKAEDLPFHMIFIGSGMDYDEIRAYTEELKLDDRCIFTGAIRDRELLRAYYSISTVFLFPSTFDTNGIVVREAAACALPSMLIKNSCAAEGIGDGETGFLVDENADSLAQFLRRVCRDPGLCAPVGERAMREIYLSWEDAVRRACDRYDIVRERFLSGAHPTPEPVSDEIFVRISDILTTINRVHAAGDELREKTEDAIRRGVDLTEKNNARIRESWRDILTQAEQLINEADALRRESTREAKLKAEEALYEAESLLRHSGQKLELRAQEFRERSNELKEHLRRLWEHLLP